MSVFRVVGREIGDRVLDAYAAVAARWADFRSTLPLAAGDFRDRLLDLAEGLAAVPGSLRERAALGEWIRFRAQGICEAVLELPAALARSGSNRLESVRNAVAGAADHEVFDFASQRARVAVGLGLFASLLAAAMVGVGFGGNAGPATAAGPAARPVAIAAPLPEGRRPVTAGRVVRKHPASTARRTVAATPAAALRATPVALRAPAPVVKSRAGAARPTTRPSSRPKKPRRGPTTSGSAPAGGSGSAPSSPPAPTAEVVNPSVSPADTAPSAGDTSSGASQSSSEPKPKPDPKPKPKPEPKPDPKPAPQPPPAPVATPPDQPKGTEGDHEGDGNHQGDKGDRGGKGDKGGKGKKSGGDD